MKIELVRIEKEPEINLVLGQTHFIKTVEDLHEALFASVPQINFGLAFSEASGSCLIRKSGTNQKLADKAAKALEKIACGHCFLVFLANAYPINVLNQIKQLPEVCQIFCATANPVEVVVARSKQGGGILGVIDGAPPKGIEDTNTREERFAFLRKIGYKLS